MISKLIYKKFALIVIIVGISQVVRSQVTDTLKTADTSAIVRVLINPEDTVLRIRNLNPYFTLHVDSMLEYQLEINKDQTRYYWYLKNSPVGLRVNKSTGLLSFKAEKSYFLSGRLKYDYEYRVNVGVQNLDNPKEKIDTSFTILFFNTEIISSRVKPTVNSVLNVDEGDTVNFKVQCDDGNFPIENITYTTNYPIKTIGNVAHCGDDFVWTPPYDFIKDNDTAKQKVLLLNFIGTNKFNTKDTAVVRIIVKESINYPQRILEYHVLRSEVEKYVIQLKGTFMVLDKKVRNTQGTRTTFDMTSASTALGGTVFSSLPTESQRTAGKILPSVGVAMVPVKESVAPTKTYEQNSASLVRSNIKRLEYILQDNVLAGDKDPAILDKSKKLRDELKQVQIQLIDVPIVVMEGTPEELDKYFNSPKVNKKYKMKNK
ncbi:MAG: hypothetical protein C5B52_00845 [Bacteroidetes bacterium]|nr:MAG: hypothetical protein C5B52_00845 [Bacteroidota bacterium]